MKIIRAYKVELDPNNVQKTAFVRHCGAARFVYNWGLNQKIGMHKTGERQMNYQKLDGQLRSMMDEEFPWLRQISSRCRLGALANLDKAYANFFNRCKKGVKGKALGFPKFKNKKRGLGSFAVFGYTVKANSVKIACIGTVRLKESNYLPVGGYPHKDTDVARFYGARISERAGRWFISVQVEIEVQSAKPRNYVVGVDVGIKALATCSDGLVFQNPKVFAENLKKLRRLSRAQSRKREAAKNSNRALHECKNYRRGKERLASLHARIKNVRTHHLHHASHVITRKSSVIGIESLNVSGMMKNRHLAKAIADASFGELLRQIQYKAQWRGGQVVVADRWFASSKTCHACGIINKSLTLAQRKWVCQCGTAHERDVNAAQNLRTLAASRAVSVCGQGSSLAEASTSARVPLNEAESGLGILKPVSPTTAENGCISV